MVTSRATALPASSPWFLILQRLHGVTGVWVLGVFVLWHLASLMPMAWGGPAAWQTLSAVRRSFAFGVIELVVLGVPFAFHVVYGFVVMRRTRPNVAQYALGANWVFTLQRYSAPVLLVLVVPHVIAMRVQPLFSRMLSVDVVYVQKHLAPILVLDLYILLVVVTAFHLWAGAWMVSVRWGFVVTQRAQRWMGFACVCAGLLTSLMGVHAAVAFHDVRYVVP